MYDLVNMAHTAIERLVHQATGAHRFTQDSPILPDVWIRYGIEGGAQDLLLVPHWRSSAVELAQKLEQRLVEGLCGTRRAEAIRDASLAHTQSTVAAKLTFAGLLRVVLPLSRWWHHYLIEPDKGSPPGDLIALRWHSDRGQILRDVLIDGLSGQPSRPVDLATGAEVTASNRHARHVTDDLLWLVNVAGTMARLLKSFPGGLCEASARLDRTPEELLLMHRSPVAEVVDAFFELFEDVPPQASPEEPLWTVNRNRAAKLAMVRSTATVKADAARKVFGVTGRDVRWAVIDSGIDATHLAFRRRALDTQRQQPIRLDPAADWDSVTRIVATYDFTSVRELLSTRSVDALSPSLRERFDADAEMLSALAAAIEYTASHGVDWMQWEPLLRVPHDGAYTPPRHRHGTHVAGILAADWRPDDDPDDALEGSATALPHEQVRLGVCPEIELHDIRVVDEHGECDEFALIAALQFIRALNARHEHVEIHGVNVSLSLLHDVANYACGQTPVCNECERLVASGVVVVAAAGNEGRARYMSTEGRLDEGYRSISITDPGNAPSVITVGATHRGDPHGYGVSYFSSRGPTGDGRLKPDLVAPGEKVSSTVPDNKEEAMDGTSMAAPHVSGAAALLLCRHPELTGRPAEIKRILCQTAVDLRRERYFQGAGLLDILHALESV